MYLQQGRGSHESGDPEDINDLQIQILPNKANKTSRSNLNAISITPGATTPQLHHHTTANKPNNNIAMAPTSTTSLPGCLATTSALDTEALQRTPLTSSVDLDLSSTPYECAEPQHSVRISAL